MANARPSSNEVEMKEFRVPGPCPDPDRGIPPPCEEL